MLEKVGGGCGQAGWKQKAMEQPKWIVEWIG